MTTDVKFASKTGGPLEGALSEPTATGRVGALVVVQEWFGVNDTMKGLCDRFAKEGFLALAPDLFHGKLATTDAEAMTLMGALDKKNAVAEIGDAAAFLKAHPRCNGKVAVVGFCLGGALAFASALRVEGLAAAVPFYGLPDMSLDEYANIRIPIQAHFAKKDDWAKASEAEERQKKVLSGGGKMDLFVYEAGHAFMRYTDPNKHHPESAKLAWERAIEFLRKHLG